LEATGTPYDEDVNLSWDHHSAVAARWPWAERQRADCPVCGRTNNVKELIAHLNNRWDTTGDDRHYWTRERIADFVETFEPAPRVAAVDPHAASTGNPTPRVPEASSISAFCSSFEDQ
jgi:hypothetical protein